MTPIADMVVKMIAAGVDPAMIALAVQTAELVREPISPPMSTDTTADRRRAKDRERRRIERGHPPTSTDSPPTPENALTLKSSKEDKKKERSRATRLSADFQPTPEMVSYSEDLGMTKTEIDEQGLSMREWSLTSPKGLKLDWSVTWQTWSRKFVKEHPRPRSQANPGETGARIIPESDQWNAWLAAGSPFQKSLMQRAQDTGQPFIAPSEYPPGHGRAA